MIDKKYDVIDGIFSIFIILLQFFGYVILMNLYFLIRNSLYQLITQLIFPVIFLVIVIVYMLIRKQKLSSIGITKKNFKKSLLLGLYFSLIYLVMFFINHLIVGDINLNTDLVSVLYGALYFLFSVSIFEEIIYRGFINSRMQGLIKNRYVTIIVVSMLFSLLHLPFNSMFFIGDLASYFKQYLGYHIILCFLHVVFQYLYDKYHSLVGPCLTHFIYDFTIFLFIGI
jgi:hypothetical protein